MFMKLTIVQKQVLSKIYDTMTDKELQEIGDFTSVSKQNNFALSSNGIGENISQ